ncbi:MAG: hypothetical protein WBA16_02195 [Nonlabens sp.]
MKILKNLVAILLFAFALTACREEPTTEEKVDAMIEDAETVKTKEDKVKLENADGTETKIKYDENGEIEKVKTDD